MPVPAASATAASRDCPWTWTDRPRPRCDKSITISPQAAPAEAVPSRAVTLADRVSLRSRRRKLALFMETMRPTAATSVLDVGVDELGFGETHTGCATINFFEELYPWPERITALGLHPGAGFKARYPEIPYVQADACALPFPDNAFDVYFSNAVLEHVGGRERQRAFVDEALRVATRVFVTTPNRWFPVEVHTRLPLVHWL